MLVITLSNLGDVVLTTPVMAALQENFREATLSIVIGERGAALFENHSRIEKVFVYDKKAPLKKKISLMFQLRNEKFDLAVDLRNSLIPVIIGARYKSPFFRVFDQRCESPHAGDKHLNILKKMGLLYKPNSKFPLHDGSAEASLRRLTAESGIDIENPYIVLAPGAKSHLKRWPSERFGLLASELHQLYRWPVILAGDQSEQDIAEKVKENASARVVNLCGKTSVTELAALIGHAALVVTNDSAALHMADLQDRAVVSIFGPTDEKKYGPRNSLAQVARKNLFCSPCEKAQCVYHHECMNELTVEEVLNVCSRLISKFQEVKV